MDKSTPDRHTHEMTDLPQIFTHINGQNYLKSPYSRMDKSYSNLHTREWTNLPQILTFINKHILLKFSHINEQIFLKYSLS